MKNKNDEAQKEMIFDADDGVNMADALSFPQVSLNGITLRIQPNTLSYISGKGEENKISAKAKNIKLVKAEDGVVDNG